MTSQIVLVKPAKIADKARDQYIAEEELAGRKPNAQGSHNAIVRALQEAAANGSLDLTRTWNSEARNSWERRLAQSKAMLDAFLFEGQGTLWDIPNNALLALGKGAHSHPLEDPCPDDCPYGKDEAVTKANLDADAVQRSYQVLDGNAQRAIARRDRFYNKFVAPILELLRQHPGKTLGQLKP